MEQQGSLLWRNVMGGVVLALALGYYDMLILFLVFIGIVPSILAFVLDRLSPRYGFANVVILNLAGVIPIAVQHIISRIAGGSSVLEAGRQLFSITHFAMMWGTAILGYVVFLTVPRMVNHYSNLQRGKEVKKMQEEQEELREEWGEGVAIVGDDLGQDA